MSSSNDSLGEIFSPKSVAVIGASRKEGTVGHTMFNNLITADFTGVVYPVNPHWPSVGGVRSYANAQALPETPELAVIMVPALRVAGTLEELAVLGTRGVIVISAGFKEVGGEGVKREAEIIDIARRNGMKLVGPNCFGVINTDPNIRLNATFSETMPRPGNIAFVSQSGALGQGILLHAKSEGLGFTKFVSVGNRAGLNETDILNSLAEDDSTKVILLYLESLAEGRRFLEVAQEVSRRKPILLIKSGRTALGEEAILSHTGNLARAHSDGLFDAVFDEAGVIRAGSIGELFHMAKVFASCPTPKGRRLGILTNSGGPGILAADAAARGGLVIPRIAGRTLERISAIAPPHSSLKNPVDMTADASAAAYRGVLDALLKERGLDNILVIATPTGNTSGMAVANSILEARKRQTKPIVACLFGVADLSEEVELLESRGVPCFTFPEEGALSLSYLSRYSGIQERIKESSPRFLLDKEGAAKQLIKAQRSGLTALPDHMTRGLMETYGFRFPRSAIIGPEEDPAPAARDIGYPLVLKVISRNILHKTDVGGVALHISDDTMLREVIKSMKKRLAKSAPSAKIDGFSLEAEISGGSEVILGVKRDQDFGPLILFGMGGVYVELTHDVGFRPAPLSKGSVDRLIGSVGASAILQGARGRKPGDIRALKDALLRLSQLALDQPMIRELDVNPLIVLDEGKGVIAVDCRAILGPLPKQE